MNECLLELHHISQCAERILNEIEIHASEVYLFVTDGTAKSRPAPSKEAMPIAIADRY